MDRAPGCPFCDIIAGDGPARVVMSGRGVTAFFPDEPATVGHTLVVPNNHVENLWDLDQGEARNLTSEVLRVARAANEALSPDGLNIIQSNGAAASQTIGHLHVHVLPRWEGDIVGDLWPGSPTWTDAELDATQASLARLVEQSPAPGYDLTRDQDREDRRRHLDLVSGVVTRLAGASAAAKGWSVTLAGAAFGVALVRESWPLILLGLCVLAAFAVLDARYLDAERRARGVYADVAEANSVAPFSMKGLATASSKDRFLWPSRFSSFSIRNFYAPLVAAGIALLVFALLNFDDAGESSDHKRDPSERHERFDRGGPLAPTEPPRTPPTALTTPSTSTSQ